jgi:hypothetical protein
LIAVERSDSLKKSFGEIDAYHSFSRELGRLYEDYGTREVKNLFIACFSEHDATDFPDGKLSMWRGYGDNGNGAAIAFQTSNLPIEQNSNLILSEVSYQSNDLRLRKISEKIDQLAEFISAEKIKREEAPEVAHAFFRRAVLAAIFTKHIGFAEEREWRLVYSPERDKSGKLLRHIDYFNSPRGLEPKLKLPLLEQIGDSPSTLSIESIIHSIVIGPRAATPLSIHAATILLQRINRESLTEKLCASSIPFRD